MERAIVSDSSRPLFSLGQIVATRRAIKILLNSDVSPEELILRHGNGDWGDLSEQDRQQNTIALRIQARLLSAYEIKGIRIWVITEADRSSTTILLPEEY